MRALGGALLWLVSRPVKKALARRTYKREVTGLNLTGTDRDVLRRTRNFNSWYETRERQKRSIIA